MLDVEKVIAEGLKGCFFTWDVEGRLENRGPGKPIWQRRQEEAIQKKVEPVVPSAPTVQKLPDFSDRRTPTMNDIVLAVSAVSQVGKADILGKCRKKHITKARQAAVRLTLWLIPKAKYWIGEHMGLNHTTVWHVQNNMSAELSAAVDRVALPALDLLRVKFPDVDAIVTEVKKWRIQHDNSFVRHHCQGK